MGPKILHYTWQLADFNVNVRKVSSVSKKVANIVILPMERGRTMPETWISMFACRDSHRGCEREEDASATRSWRPTHSSYGSRSMAADRGVAGEPPMWTPSSTTCGVQRQKASQPRTCRRCPRLRLLQWNKCVAKDR